VRGRYREIAWYVLISPNTGQVSRSLYVGCYQSFTDRTATSGFPKYWVNSMWRPSRFRLPSSETDAKLQKPPKYVMAVHQTSLPALQGQPISRACWLRRCRRHGPGDLVWTWTRHKACAAPLWGLGVQLHGGRFLAMIGLYGPKCLTGQHQLIRSWCLRHAGESSRAFGSCGSQIRNKSDAGFVVFVMWLDGVGWWCERWVR